MAFRDFFAKKQMKKTMSKWSELGTYKAMFSAFGSDIYASEIVRACIRPLAEFSSKATAKCPGNERIEKLLNNKPNMYMTGEDFLLKVRTRLEIYNTVFIFINRDEKNNVIGYYPVPYSSFEALEYNNGLFIKFYFASANDPIVLPWDDLAPIRKDYNKSDIAGDGNDVIINTLDLINTTNQGIANSIKATANLRGILKSTKSMLAAEDIKKQKEQFVKDYLNLENEGGIASLDATQDFTPISMNPMTASSDQMKEFRENVYRYFGVNEKVVTSDMTSDEIEGFYEVRIEPFLVRLSSALTSKTFSPKEISYGNKIIYEANKLQFCSLDKKIQLFKEVVLYGGMLINEWREGCNMPPIEGGDKPIRRLDAAPTTTTSNEEGANEDGN